MTAISAFISAAPLLISRSRNRHILNPRISVTASASSKDDDFFLPAEARQVTRKQAQADSVPMSIAARRAHEKQIELTRRKQAFDEDDELRSQIVSEQLSADDLFSPSDLASTLSSDQLINPSAAIPPPPPSSTLDSNADPVDAKPASSVKPVRRRKKPRANPTNPDVKLPPVTVDPNPVHDDVLSADMISTSDLAPTLEAAVAAANPSSKNGASSSPPPPPPNPSNKASLSIGDLVRHERHGIGRFCGLERTRNREDDPSLPIQEFVVLEYRDGDVYVPLSHLELIERLDDMDAKAVTKLDVISPLASYPHVSPSRRRANYIGRRRTREKIRKQLVNLHGMYAQRTTLERDPFPVNEAAEEHFSKICDFTLTNDQVTATRQIFHDMSESRRPMDRLLCGDVGFGKTEVAIRAAFRALCAGFQVAILAPTTILAQQHYDTFRQRFEQYSEFKIACLTRFVSRRLILEAREGIRSGTVNIAIGTHMLLSDLVVFNNLGLLIVDEEHRFGVNQKEKIRSRYRSTDALFLSATPIPRTLHLALSGLRDASVLNTPPKGRKPIVTRTSRIGAGVVRSAIQNELRRGGQVFYVVPRIEGIEATATWLRDLIDDLRVLVAHGGRTDLEQRIWAFSQREYDVLLCTTIIENGINMPDVNTIIIQDANRFGLAQLHQLRGRVGRSDIQAYAWILYMQHQAENLQSLQRLKALEEYSALGAGFAIAQRDMEMRGVGTILGVEQHGNNSVHADEYARMLSEELEHARTGRPIPITLPTTESVEIFLPVASLIPEDYIHDLNEKMKVYRLLAQAKSKKQLDQEVRRLEKNFGPVPTALRRHVSILEVKMFAKQLGISKIVTERQHVVLEWVLEEVAFKRLVVFLPDEQSRSRCEHLEADERVVIRGLGICTGDVQLAKVLHFLEMFNKAAEGLAREAKEDPLPLANAMNQWELPE